MTALIEQDNNMTFGSRSQLTTLIKQTLRQEKQVDFLVDKKVLGFAISYKDKVVNKFKYEKNI